MTAKVFSVFGMVVSIVFLLVFALDLAVGMPFGGASWIADIGFIICAILLGYMSWTTYREQS
jgi:hypothetical protein